MVSKNEHPRNHELYTTETLRQNSKHGLAKYTMMNERTRIQKNKLRTFRKFKPTNDYENYLTNVRNINHRVAITKLRLSNHKLAIETGRYVKPYQPPDQRICPLCKTGIEDEEHFLMNCIAHRDPRRELINTLKKETNLILDSMTPSSAFATLLSMKQGEKTQKIVAKYVYYRFRERDRRVKYNLV